jgi:general secretion pathway protein J
MPMHRRPARGFTLVEVLVALFVMAVLSGMAWQGVDSMLRTRELTQAAIERTSRLNTVLAQWEQDLAALHDSGTVPALQFDGGSLRLTRRTDDGVQTVVWSVRDDAWWRWSAPATTRAEALQQQWLASQQLQGNEPGQLRLIDGATGWQVYFYRGNAWSNAQSSGELASRAGAQPGAAQAEQLPTGVRLVIELPGGALTRDLLVPPQAQ